MGRLTTTIATSFIGAPSRFCRRARKNPPLRNEKLRLFCGGPVVKNKLFYFASYEKQQYIIGLSVWPPSLPTPGLCRQQTFLTIPAVSTARTLQSRQAHCLVRHRRRLDAAAASWARAAFGPGIYWRSSWTNNNFFSPVASTGYSYNGTGKVDYQINDKTPPLRALSSVAKAATDCSTRRKPCV